MVTKAEYDMAQEIICGLKPRSQHRHTFAFTGMIRCGGCGASVTAEEKTKNQKNGNIHKYVYYRCTRRINPDCSEPPIRDSELETQILDLLDGIAIPPEFHQWAMKCLKEEQSKEVENRENVQEIHRKRLDTSQKKLDTLLEMRLSGELNSEEYILKKEVLFQEHYKIEELLRDGSHRTVTWLDRADKLFDFAETAKKRFEEGDLDVKREILSCLGTNFVLKVRTLHLETKKPIVLLKHIAPEVQALHQRLEPLNPAEKSTKLELFYSQNKGWGRELVKK